MALAVSALWCRRGKLDGCFGWTGQKMRRGGVVEVETWCGWRVDGEDETRNKTYFSFLSSSPSSRFRGARPVIPVAAIAVAGL
jgi:hypothetical protein